MKTKFNLSCYKNVTMNMGKLVPVLVMKMNSREPLVVIDFEHFIELIKPE